ncbi:hypothetical protein NMG60_11034873 [Bertholletia excelsa]
MGFNSVYRVLQEVFPQVDTRLLRAVAIEHSKDADTAVEVVLTEIIPFLPERSAISGSSTDSTNDSYQPGRTEDKGLSHHDSDDDHDYNGHEELVKLGEPEKYNVTVRYDATPSGVLICRDDDCKQLHVNTEGEDINLLQELSNVNMGFDRGLKASSTSSKDSFGINGMIEDNFLVDFGNFSGTSASDGSMATCIKSGQHQACFNECCNQLEVDNSACQLSSSPLKECTSATQEHGLQQSSSPLQECVSGTQEHELQLTVEHTRNGEHEKLEPGDNWESASRKEIKANEMVDFEEESALNTVVTRSGQICRIDLLEDIIEDARNNKKTLFSAVESVIGLMREVELQEKAAEQAKEEAVRGGLDILTRVEDLKQMLQHAKEANDMHAGEVYGERAILATEVRELQSRLLSLSDERDKSLAVLDEMHQALEERLQAAEEERKEAEQEKMEKEGSARNALAEQQLMMEKVVQESEMLKQESEENSKLREFLMDRGRLVDTLQGEISVICQDVKLLKEKFDERVPLSKSLSSSGTSCILASSSSSLKSMSPDQVPEQADLSDMPDRMKPSPPADNGFFLGAERVGAGSKKTLVEDGWELFDNQECDG